MSKDESDTVAPRPWQTSWRAFGAELQHQIHEGASGDDLGRIFGGHQVTWRGQIESIDIDDLSAAVNIALDEMQIVFPDGGVTRLDGISLPVANNLESQWRCLEVGSEVCFQATILPMGSAPFPPIELKTLRSGARLIMLRLAEGRPRTLQ